MYELLVEKHSLENKPLSRRLACHMSSRGSQGKVAVVTDKSKVLLSTTCKQWSKLLRQTQNERSSTLNPVRINMHTGQILWMQGLSFTSKEPDDLFEADITFATDDDFEREKVHILTTWMPRNSSVVIHE